MNYATYYSKEIGPNNLSNNEWLIIAIRYSVKALPHVVAFANRPGNISLPLAKMVQEHVYKSFILFQTLSEAEVPIHPWLVSQEQWDAVTHKEIVDCKTDLLNILQDQVKSKGPFASLAHEFVLNSLDPPNRLNQIQ